jgi:hypothetical protein
MFLRQSTTITIRMGPALDKTDGVTEETALSPIVEVSKNNGAFAARSSATAITHDSNGWYAVELNTTDTNTVGWLIAKFDDVATHLPVWHEFWVLEEAIYDALFAASAAGFDANADVTVGGFAAGAITAAAIAADAITAARWRLMYPPRELMRSGMSWLPGTLTQARPGNNCGLISTPFRWTRTTSSPVSRSPWWAGAWTPRLTLPGWRRELLMPS